MLHTLRARAQVKLTAAETRRVIGRLRAADWRPVGLEAELAVAELVGLSEEAVIEQSMRRRSGPSERGVGDLVVRDGLMYYVVAINADEARAGPFFDPDDDSPEEPDDSLEVGIVSEDADNLQKCLEEFRDAVVQGIKETIDGRRFRHLSFNWSIPSSNTGKLRTLCERLEKEGAQVRFDPPALTDESISAARNLLEPPRREILRDLSASGGFALETDIVRSRGDESKAVLDDLVRTGLASRSQLVQCRQSSRPLTRVDDPDVLREGSGGHLRCATCNRKFEEELLIPGYGIAEVGSSLIRGSHWMTVWVTEQLLALGADSDAILWNLEESSEEIDIVLEFLGELWIVELKDRDFHQRDAHSLNYRRVRYRPDKTFVITSGVVSADARRVFEDVARENRERTRYWGGPDPVTPTYIEGLQAIPAGLRAEFDRAARGLAMRSVAGAAISAGFQPARLLAAMTVN